MTYINGKEYRIIVRYAERITGSWSEADTLVWGEDYPELYGSFLHPLKDGKDMLYFRMSLVGALQRIFNEDRRNIRIDIGQIMRLLLMFLC